MTRHYDLIAIGGGSGGIADVMLFCENFFVISLPIQGQALLI